MRIIVTKVTAVPARFTLQYVFYSDFHSMDEYGQLVSSIRVPIENSIAL